MNIAKCFGNWLLGFLALGASGWVAAADLYVAPDGKDTAPGTQDQPFATVAQAQKAVRELWARKPARTTPIVVQLRGGFYELAEPIRFEPADSGTPQSPVVYEGKPGTLDHWQQRGKQ